MKPKLVIKTFGIEELKLIEKPKLSVLTKIDSETNQDRGEETICDDQHNRGSQAD